MRRLSPALVLIAAIAGFSMTADAYVLLPYRWTTSSVRMNLRLGSTTLATPLIDGARTWNSVGSTALRSWNPYMLRMQFGVGSTTGQRAAYDRRNYAFFASSAYGRSLGSNVLGVAYTWYSGSQALDSDVVINTRFRWNSYRGALRAGVYDIRRVLIHEFGHTLGLNHSTRAGAIMRAYVSNVDRQGSDDIAGARRIYGTR